LRVLKLNNVSVVYVMKCEDDRKDEYFRYIAIVDGTLMITEDGYRMVGYILKFDEESKNING